MMDMNTVLAKEMTMLPTRKRVARSTVGNTRESLTAVMIRSPQLAADRTHPCITSPSQGVLVGQSACKGRG